jgi:Domain of unknown function (DUF4020)
MSRNGITVVVDAARDVLSSLSAENEEAARATIERWFASPSPLLRRLAVNAISEAEWLNSDERIGWLLDHNLLYDVSVKAETFRILSDNYPRAGEEVRQQVLVRVKRGIRAQDNPRLEKETRDYERYNLLQWLARAAPDDETVNEALRLEQERHPDFAPRGDPDLEVGEVRAVSAESSMTVERLLKMRVGDVRVASKLVDFRDESHWFDTRRFAFLEVVADATAAKPDWGLRLGKALARQGNWNVDLWRGVVQGWARSKPADRTWSEVFDLLAAHQQPTVFVHEAGHLLSEFIQAQVKPDTEAVRAAVRMSEILWRAAASSNGTWVIEGRDWLTAAINEPGGKIAEFWIRLVSLRARTGETGLVEEDRARFTMILNEPGATGEAGRILLASQFHFLLAVDRKWTLSWVLPLFDWGGNERAAEQSWDGFLTWAHLNEAVIETMLPMYVATFSRLDERTDEWRRKFTNQLAVVAVRSSRNPVEDKWLVPFVTAASVDARAEWSSHVAFLLRSLDADAKVAQWEKWIRRYWTDRLSGIPRSLTSRESGELAAWAVSLEPVFADAARLLAEGPLGRPEGYVYDLLGRSVLPEREPSSVLTFLKHVLGSEGQPFWACHYALLILERLPRDEYRQESNDVVNLLVGLGCQDATRFAS